MENNKSLLDQVKLLIQVGDTHYLEKVLQKNKVTSPSDYSKLIAALKTKEDFNLAHQLCKLGSLETLTFFKSKTPKDPVLALDFIDQNELNCLHYSIARNHYDFTRYLLKDHQPKLNVNQLSHDTQESPLFFALGKLKNHPQEKVKMVKLLLEDSNIEVGLLNADKKACYEAYNDQFGFDEASNLVEKRHLRGSRPEEDVSSSMFYKDFDKSQRDTLLDKKTSAQDKFQLIERHILDQAGADLNFNMEIRNQLRQSQAIQERLKSMQNEQVYDPVKYIESEQMKKQLQKKLMEFCGTTLIQNIKNMYSQ